MADGRTPFDQRPHIAAFGDVALHEGDGVAVDHALEALEMAGIGELVEHHQPRHAGRLGPAHEVAADEAGAAGDDPGGRGGEQGCEADIRCTV